MALQWKRVARRIRVPLGFAFAVFYLWMARPRWMYLGISLILVVTGLLLRGYASGYVKKNAELTVTGPYAHTRNPLYLGSMLIAAGFAVAARSVWIAAVLIILFLAIYIPVIRGEEEYLRAAFSGFELYASRVPRLIPRITPARQPGEAAGVFSPALYRKHREYNALLGAAAMYAALILKLFFLER